MSTRAPGRTAMAVEAATVLALAGTVAGQPPAPGFHLVGLAPGTTASRAYAVSADGSVAAGYSIHTAGPYLLPGYLWTASSGRSDFGLESGLPPDTEAYAVSSDGTTVVGTSRTTGSSPTLAYRYRGPGTFQTLGVLPALSSSQGTGVSGDGSVVAGYCQGSSGFPLRAFRWTQAGGMQELLPSRTGNLDTEANGISRNGLVSVGLSVGPTSTDACVWTVGTATPVVLPALPGGQEPVGDAFGANADGTIIVGSSGTPDTAVIWRNGQISILGTPAGVGWTFSLAYGVSDDGSVAVGHFHGGTAAATAAVWTAAGPVRLTDYLSLRGVSVPDGWTLSDCTGVSLDGLTFCGVALSGPSGQQGFVATIPPPCPADFDHDGRIAPSDVAVFVNAWFASLVGGTLTGDFDGNGQVQPADVSAYISVWFNALANGC